MPKDEKHRLAPPFQRLQRKRHQPLPDPQTLPIRPHRKGRQHARRHPLPIRALDPNPRKHDMPDKARLILGHPLAENAAVRTEAIEKGWDVFRPEGFVDEVPGWCGIAIIGAANMEFHRVRPQLLRSPHGRMGP